MNSAKTVESTVLMTLDVSTALQSGFMFSANLDGECLKSVSAQYEHKEVTI